MPSLSLHRRCRPAVEQLESREPAAGFGTTALEQLFIERLNDMRANPAAFGFNYPAVQPFAPTAGGKRVVHKFHPIPFNKPIPISAMKAELNRIGGGFDNNHSVIVAPSFGYVGFDQDLNLAMERMVTQSVDKYLLSRAAVHTRAHRHIGIEVTATPGGESEGVLTIGTLSMTALTFTPANTKPTLTGVVFRDNDGDGKYDLGEGLSGVSVQIKGGGGRAQTSEGGGYTIQTNRTGRVQVTANGGGLTFQMTQTVSLRPSRVTRLTFLAP